MYGVPGWEVVKDPSASAGDAEACVRPLGQEGPLQEGMATHSSILAWRIPWTEELGVDCHSLLQGIFLTQGSNPGLLRCRQILHHLSYREVLININII